MERLTAKKCSVRDLVNGEYQEHKGKPNELITPNGPTSRVNLIATVVTKQLNTLLLDDGTGTIEVRSFNNQQLFSHLKIGEVILLIGRPLKYGGRPYLVGEIAKKLNLGWLKLRKRELEEGNIGRTKDRENVATTKDRTPPKNKTQTSTLSKENVIETVSEGNSIHMGVGKVEESKNNDEKNSSTKKDLSVDEKGPTMPTSEAILKLVKELDKGDGAPKEIVLSELSKRKHTDGENSLTTLLAEGEIFENKRGRIKLV